MAFQSGVDPSTTSDINKIIERTEQTENQIIKLQKQIEFLEAGDYKTFIMCKIVQIREKMQQLNNKQKLLTEINTNLKQEISSLTTSIHKLESDQKQQELNNENKQDNNNDDGMNDASHGYANKKLSGMCQCEMCREGIATTHNDESHDQSLFGTFTLDVDDKFTLNLVGGSTKCGRVMANYFGYLEINKKINIFKDKKCLEVGSGTGIVGCTIAYLNANKVMMTDQPGVIEILSENAKQLNKYNNLFDNKIEIGELLWGKDDANKYVNGEYDILIGSDLIYAHEFIQPLVITFEVLSENKNKNTGKHPIVFMSVIRRFKWEENFFNLMKNKFVEFKELEVGDICIYKYVRKEDIDGDKQEENDKQHNDDEQ